ncbi:MAG: YdiU family protein [Bacteroidia bacterium]|jgi:uncharacterized protein YdiU (UPF0061 family)|nr:YdiU family protein [Bacteroidia bacterium]
MSTSNKLFNFDYSYTSLPNIFFSLVKPTRLNNPQLVLVNRQLCKDLNISFESSSQVIDALLSESDLGHSFAQAYAGHQFGHFTMLGDGRAIVIGEHITNANSRFDIQLKGSGITPYSRRGDGKATLKAMLREYLISEAMHYLNIPTSRSLTVFKTGEPVYREAMHEGAMLARVMLSHIRVGTFEYAKNFGTIDDLQALTTYTIKRLYPELLPSENQALALLKKVIDVQTALVVNWMRVGFIHGVMNTDNTAISGETFDYGPCAFMNAYHPQTVYSSIDTQGRYAFGNQPNIIYWNITRLAEALLPLIHQETQQAISLAQQTIDQVEQIWYQKYYQMMLSKLGILIITEEGRQLVDELLSLMQLHQLDYTNTFAMLTRSGDTVNESSLQDWSLKWKRIIIAQDGQFERARLLMEQENPVVVPRNHLVEHALDNAITGDFELFDQMLKVLKMAYNYEQKIDAYLLQPDLQFDQSYQTFCGT